MGDIGSRQVRFEVLPASTGAAGRHDPQPEPAPAPVVHAEPRERDVVRAEPARS